jgi:hypothetical protein
LLAKPVREKTQQEQVPALLLGKSALARKIVEELVKMAVQEQENAREWLHAEGWGSLQTAKDLHAP